MKKGWLEEDRCISLSCFAAHLACNSSCSKLNEEGGNLGGFSLAPFLQDSNTSEWKGPNGALSIVGNYGKTIPTDKQNFSYRTEKFRYIKYSNGSEELYDHEKDPYEWENIAHKKKSKKIKADLRSQMELIISTR